MYLPVHIASLLFQSFNIIVPVVFLMVLNFLSYRKIKEMSMALASDSDNTEKQHDLDLCLRTVYAVLIYGLCHGAEIIFSAVTEVYMEWDVYVILSNIFNLLLVVASSLNYFIYYGVYGKLNTVENENTGHSLNKMETIENTDS